MPSQSLSDSALAEPVITVQRAHEPALLELAEPTILMELEQPDLRVHRAHVHDACPQLDPLEGAGSPEPLQSVQHLQLSALVPECHHWLQLAVAVERTAHGGQLLRLTETKLAEPVS